MRITILLFKKEHIISRKAYRSITLLLLINLLTKILDLVVKNHVHYSKNGHDSERTD